MTTLPTTAPAAASAAALATEFTPASPTGPTGWPPAPPRAAAAAPGRRGPRRAGPRTAARVAALGLALAAALGAAPLHAARPAAAPASAASGARATLLGVPALTYGPIVRWCLDEGPAAQRADLQRAWAAFQTRVARAAAPLLALPEVAAALNEPLPTATLDELQAMGQSLREQLRQHFSAADYCPRMHARLDAIDERTLRESIEAAYDSYVARAAARAAPPPPATPPP